MPKKISMSTKAAKKHVRKQFRYVAHKTPTGSIRLTGHKRKCA